MGTVSNAVDVIEARKAAIGDGAEVRRLLPQRTLRTIGAWCFLDHYGPDEVSRVPVCRSRPIRTSACRRSAGCSRAWCCTGTASAAGS